MQGNSYRGNDVVDRFVKHFDDFFNAEVDIFPIYNPDGLFTKKLDTVTALELISDVSENEIKLALFDIDDDKASGPDGFTSKNFKAAWSVVGHDTCAAFKEFSQVVSCLVSLILPSSLSSLKLNLLHWFLIIDQFHTVMSFIKLLVKL